MEHGKNDLRASMNDHTFYFLLHHVCLILGLLSILALFKYLQTLVK